MFKLITFFIICSTNIYAGTLKVFANLSPAGTLEIKSDKVLGDIQYNSDSKQISSDYIFIPVSSLSSNIDLRDEHILKFLNSKAHSNISMKNVLISIPGLQGSGELFLGGKRKKVSFEISKVKTGHEAKFSILLSEYGFEKPKFMGIEVNDKIYLEVFIDNSELRNIK